jgi:rRNA-processing protein FCF1
VRLLLDADALIKLNRAEILVTLLDSFDCAVPQAVYEEVVVVGHARGYADAEAIGSAVAGRCGVEETTESSLSTSLGVGETALLALVEAGEQSIVISDDARFLGVLRSRGIDYLGCARLVVYLVRNNLLTLGQATEALRRMRSLVSPKSFDEATETLDRMWGIEMKKTKVVPLRIPESLDEVASLRAEFEHTDKATALRQWLHEGAEKYVMKMLGEARISKGRAVELLGISIYDIYPLVEKYGLELGPSDEQLRQSQVTAERLKLALKTRP